MAETLTAVVGALKGLGAVGSPAAIALAGHPMLAVIIGGLALVAYLVTDVARHVRQYLGDTVGRKLGTLSASLPAPDAQSTPSVRPLPPSTTPQPVP